jgi:hypothetical protein
MGRDENDVLLQLNNWEVVLFLKTKKTKKNWEVMLGPQVEWTDTARRHCGGWAAPVGGLFTSF